MRHWYEAILRFYCGTHRKKADLRRTSERLHANMHRTFAEPQSQYCSVRCQTSQLLPGSSRCCLMQCDHRLNGTRGCRQTSSNHGDFDAGPTVMAIVIKDGNAPYAYSLSLPSLRDCTDDTDIQSVYALPN